MNLSLPLRAKILFLTVVPLVVLAIATVWTVNHRVIHEADDSVREELLRASEVLEKLLAARASSLEIAGGVVVRDPRFFSVLTLPGLGDDPQIRATVAGVTSDFNSITRSDLFELYASDGTRLAVSGSHPAPAAAARPLVRRGLAGAPISAVMADGDAHAQVTVTPVRAGGRVVGALLLGADMGKAFAEQLRELTKSEVTFLSGALLCGTTLDNQVDRQGLLSALGPKGRRGGAAQGPLLEVRAADHTYLTLVRPIPGTAPEAGQLYVMQRALDVETAYLRDIQKSLALIGGGAALLALLAGIFISSRITAPVQRLVRGAEEMERGNYDFPLEIRRRDEIGYLAERFQDMRRHLRLYVNSLEEVARMRSEFISIASHELRTPITIIRGFQELMEQEMLGPLTPQQRHALQGIGRSLGTLTGIAEDATRLSLVESDQLQLRVAEHDLAAVMHEAVESARAAAPGRQVKIENQTPRTIGAAQVDGPRLAQAVSHLLRNGIRFTPDGGQVRLETRREGPTLVVRVADTGVGIPETERARLERGALARSAMHHHSSNTLEFNSAGLGMGLSIARGVVAAHGGTLEIASEVDRGTTVTLRLPVWSVSHQARAA